MDHGLPDPPRSTVTPLRCGACGGSFQEGDASCPWCGGGIALEDRGRSHVCSRCAVRAPTGATWCPGCGERLGEQPIAGLSKGARCPACESELRSRTVGSHRMTECGGCGGLWLAAEILEVLCGTAERAGLANVAPTMPSQRAGEAVRYRPCPACRALMSRKNFGDSSGVVVDVCRAHGVWLDPLELERVLAWARAGGPERERQRRIERLRSAEARVERPTRPTFHPEPVLAEGGFGLLEVLSDLLKRLG